MGFVIQSWPPPSVWCIGRVGERNHPHSRNRASASTVSSRGQRMGITPAAVCSQHSLEAESVYGTGLGFSGIIGKETWVAVEVSSRAWGNIQVWIRRQAIAIIYLSSCSSFLPEALSSDLPLPGHSFPSLTLCLSL